MSSLQDADHRVLEVIGRSPGSVLLDDLVRECSDLTWNQVFMVIDRLSREGGAHDQPQGAQPVRDPPFRSRTTRNPSPCHCVITCR